MKIIQIAFLLMSLSFAVTSCSSDDAPTSNSNPVVNLIKIYEFEENGHLIELYSEKANLEIGYNAISIRIKNTENQHYINDAQLEWTPMMHMMMMMQHSAPHSNLSNINDPSVYEGYVIFQMAENDSEYWTLDFNYLFNNEVVTTSKIVSVKAPLNELSNVQSFIGSDNNRYILAYVNPQLPKVATNDFTALLYKMNSMTDFSIVENYKITVDPRMPGMGNHTSPNNQDLVYNSITRMYEGKISLTMTGYWKINMQLLNNQNEIIKGESVTSENPSSSLFFEIEF